MKILGLDPGTKCGYANNYSKDASGFWDLTPKRLEGPGMRYLRFRNFLVQMIAYGAELVAFEEVRRHAGTAAAHVYGGIVANIMSICEEKKILYTSVPIGTWKKIVTGKGTTKPADYLKFVQANGAPGCTSEDEAAALCILEWAELEYDAQLKFREPDILA